MKRTIFIILAGVIVIGGAGASAKVEINCTQCKAGVVDCEECRRLVICPYCDPIMIRPGMVLGDPDCPECEGSGLIVMSTGFFINYFEVECGCRGKNPECPICDGTGSYPSRTTGMCEDCQGKGGGSCPHCGGSGKIKANEKILKVLRLR